MAAHFTDLQQDRLLELSAEVSLIAGTLARLSLAQSPTTVVSADSEEEEPEVRVDLLRYIIRSRQLRKRFLPNDLFAEPAWDMMLDLLESELSHRRTSVSSLCLAAGVPATTALRVIKKMAEDGHLVRVPDQHDGRRTYIELSPTLRKSLKTYFAKISEPATAWHRRSAA